MSQPPPGEGAADTLEEVLAGSLLTTARELLERNGVLYPFGGLLPAGGGEVELVTPRGDSPYPLPDRLLEEVVTALRDAAGRGRAAVVGVCADVLVRLPGERGRTDAVRVAVERPGAAARAYHLPYRRRQGGLRFEEMLVAPAEPLLPRAGAEPGEDGPPAPPPPER